MGASLRRIDVVYKCVDILGIGIIVLHGYFHIHAFPGSLAVNNLIVDRGLALVQVCDEFLDSALIVEYLFFLFVPVILENNLQVFRQERRLPEADFEGIIIIDCLFKYFLVRQKGNSCAVLFRTAFAHNL